MKKREKPELMSGNMIEVARMALECSKAMREMADMTNVLGKCLIMLSHEIDKAKEATQ